MNRRCSLTIIAALLMHLQCGSSCLAESLGSRQQTTPISTEPPCHQHSQAPSNDPVPKHETNTPCTQGPAAEAKSLLCRKNVHLHVAALLPLAAPVLTLEPAIEANFRWHNPPDESSPPKAVSVLRI